jgi:hypothetical protein
MNTGRTGGALLLAGIFIVCLSSAAFAKVQNPSTPARPATTQADNRTSTEELEAAQQALMSRIRELEETQARMRDQIRDITNETQARQGLDPEVGDGTSGQSSSFNWLLGGFTVFACALCVILLLRVRQPGHHDSEATTTSPTLSPPASAPAPTQVGEDDGDTRTELIHPFVPSLPDWDAASPAIDLHGISIFSPDAKIQAHDSAIELADIMLSFGRVNSAAEALASFIEKNPREAVTPWLKLLDVYRESGQRAEFDKIAKELNRTFNVWGVTWENFDDSRDPAHGLEEMPHIISRLQQLWGSRKCQAYLQYLLRDTRNATRQGFSLITIDDILCLNAILKDDLGPYTGPVDIFAANDADGDEAPLTETEPETRPGGEEITTTAPETEEKAEEPAADEPEAEEKAEEPAADEPEAEEKAEEPAADEPEAEEKAEEPATDEPEAEEKAEEPAADEPKAEEKTEEPARTSRKRKKHRAGSAGVPPA